MLTALAHTSSTVHFEGFDFAFSKGALTANEIFDSSTSPPGRYVVELGRRLLKAAPSADVLIIANPLLPLKAAQVAGWLQGRIHCPAILSDVREFPLLYILPRWICEEMEPFLQLLSTVDARIDARLLQGLLGCEVERTQLPQIDIGRYPLSTSTGWFQGTERQKVLKVLAANAVKIVETNRGWRTLPFAVYHPYHAGSIVFFAMASRDVTTPLFQRHILCSPYKDIVAATESRLDPIWLKLTWLPRDNSIGEPQYFSHALDRLGAEVTDNTFIVFMRYSRISGHSPFHMIDHDRFSLGESLETVESTRQVQAPLVSAKCRLPTEPFRVLFHITGGLPIKTYPSDYAKAVFRSLAALGIEVTVIGRPDLEGFGARSIAADETDLLCDAVSRHHIFVGLDSFPHHFVRNVMGWPTIGLFGNTTAANFGGGWNSHYRSLDVALPCHPCGGERECPVFARPECSNYAKPQQLIAAILEMAEQAYGFSA
jgi:hypothetical protein